MRLQQSGLLKPHELLKCIEGAFVDARQKCELVWKLIGGGETREITTKLENMEKKENEGLYFPGKNFIFRLQPEPPLKIFFPTLSIFTIFLRL